MLITLLIIADIRDYGICQSTELFHCSDLDLKRKHVYLDLKWLHEHIEGYNLRQFSLCGKHFISPISIFSLPLSLVDKVQHVIIQYEQSCLTLTFDGAFQGFDNEELVSLMRCCCFEQPPVFVESLRGCRHHYFVLRLKALRKHLYRILSHEKLSNIKTCCFINHMIGKVYCVRLFRQRRKV